MKKIIICFCVLVLIIIALIGNTSLYLLLLTILDWLMSGWPTFGFIILY